MNKWNDENRIIQKGNFLINNKLKRKLCIKEERTKKRNVKFFFIAGSKEKNSLFMTIFLKIPWDFYSLVQIVFVSFLNHFLKQMVTNIVRFSFDFLLI